MSKSQNAKLSTPMQRANMRRRIVKLRTKDLLSWKAIAEILEIAPRTVRRLFQEVRGEHQHHDHIEGRGGRFPAQWTSADGAFLPGDGSNNAWERIPGSDIDAEVRSGGLA